MSLCPHITEVCNIVNYSIILILWCKLNQTIINYGVFGKLVFRIMVFSEVINFQKIYELCRWTVKTVSFNIIQK